MKRVVISLLVLVTLLLSACTAVAPAAPAAEPAATEAAGGEAAASAGGEYTVGLAWNRKDQSLIQAWEDYMVASGKALEAKDGIKLNWVINVADGDPARLASNIEDLINQGVDIIVTRPEDAAAIGASIKAANEAGIPVVTFDRASSTEKPAAHVGADSYNQAISTAEAFAKILDDAGRQGQMHRAPGPAHRHQRREPLKGLE